MRTPPSHPRGRAGTASGRLLICLSLLGGTLVVARGQTYEVLHSFSAERGGSQAGLLKTADGKLYGTTFQGGFSGKGSIFVLTPDGAGGFTFATLHEFVGSDGYIPCGELIRGTDGNFYGMTNLGGTSNAGTVFRMDASGNLTTLHSFDGSDGANPRAGLIQASDGNFYGTTSYSFYGSAGGYGTVFKMDASGNLTTLHSFAGSPSDGAYSWAPLVEGAAGIFYGTTYHGGNGYGTAFKIDRFGNETVLHNFDYPAEGYAPQVGLIKATDGAFYGATLTTAFKMDASGSVTTLHTFSGNDVSSPSAAFFQAADGNFYGTSSFGGWNGYGTLFRMDGAGNVTPVHYFSGSDGANPSASLIQDSDGSFYGTTSAVVSGAGPGTVFKLDGSGLVTTLHTFAVAEASSPSAGLIQAADGSFYGVTGGSANYDGTVFRLDGPGNFSVLHFFAESDGASPAAALVRGTDGNFYGTTSGGGSRNAGTLFRMDGSGNVTMLYDFWLEQESGAHPRASLLQGTDGYLYGTNSESGANWRGTVFRTDLSGDLTVLHHFTGSDGDGSSPHAGLVQGTDGSLYGTAAGGGGSNAGTVFRMQPSGAFTTIHSFAGTDGAYPEGGLIRAADGNFYGTTSQGGGDWGDGSGTVFKIDGAGNLTTLHVFAGSDGASPGDALIQAPDGSFYGTTRGGGQSNAGTIFRMDASGNVTTLHSFVESDGAYPVGSLIQAANGSLYGVTQGGGAGAAGVIYRLTLAACPAPPVAGNDGPVCEGQTLHLTASTVDGATYTWTGPNGFVSNLQNPSIPGATAAASGVYSVTATAGSCTSTAATTMATVNASPTAVASGSATIVAGGSTPLTGSGGGGCLWSPSTGLSSPFACSPTAYPSVTTTYTLTVFAANGCSSFNNPTVTVTVLSPTTTTVSSSANPSALGQGVTFTATATSGSGTPTGTVTFKDGSLTLASAALTGGAATFTTSALSNGNHAISAAYGGDASFGASQSAALIQAVGGPPGYEVIHGFSLDTGGNAPSAGLIRATDGNFYGTTRGGGVNDNGTAFRMDASGSVTFLHSFTYLEGAIPLGGLIQGTDGNFYGTTYYLGPGSYGTVFQMTAAGNVTVLHSFDGNGGLNPYAGLIQAADGNFYGTTYNGGFLDRGTAFQLSPSGTLTTLHNFDGGDGFNPYAGLIQGTDGNFYGTTENAGAVGYGTVFKMSAAGSVTVLHSFAGSDGSTPQARLIQATDGNFYGTTRNGGANDHGTVFEIDAAGNFTTLHFFAGSDGSNPTGALIQAPDGSLYGTASSGGPGGGGVVFRVPIPPCPPPPVAGNDGPICAGQALHLTATTVPGAAYGWTGPNGFTSSLQNPSIPNATSAASGIYTVRVTAGSCASSAAATAATVHPSVTAAASGSATITAGESTPLTGSGGSSCSWAPAAGLSSAASCSPTASPSVSTTYTLTVSDANGCVSTNNPTVTVTVLSATTTTVSSSANPSAAGQSVTFTATVGSGFGTPTGTVTFKEGAATLGTGALSAGTASYATSALSLGSHTITALYGGSGSFGQSSSPALTQNVLAAPKLTVTKVVVNDNGGTKVVGDFPLFVDGSPVTSGAQNSFNAGAHTVSETSGGGYAATFGGDCASNGSITLALGDVKSCTITNNDVAPKLTVTKIVVNNNGGTKVVSNFPLFVDGISVISGAQNSFNAGTHTVSETSSPGYAATFSGDCASNGSITVNPGDVKNCTITNDDFKLPDLTVSALTAPAVAAAGSTISINDTTQNVTGSGAAAASTTRFYLSANSTWDAGDIVLGDRSVPAFAAGGTSSGSISVTIPAGTATATWFIFARADADAALTESNENNNTRSVSIKISPPDLIVSAVSAPATGGAGLTISVTDTTKNQGTGPAGASTTRFYLSTNTTWEAGDTLLGSRAVAALAAAASSSGSTTLTIPAGTGTGTWYVIAKADADGVVSETIETNNNAPSAAILIGPDLIVSAIAAPATGGAGLAISVTDTTKNQTATGAAGASTTRFYLSNDATWDATDLLFASSRAIPALAPGAVSTGSTSLTIPAGTAPGVWYVIARADADNAVAETTETNNTASDSILVGPDLVVSALSAPATGGAGLAITVTDTAKNQGAGSATASTTRFYLSTNSTFSGDDVLLGSRAVAALNPGATSAGSTSVTIPAGTAVGDYYIVAVGDAASAVAETDETNNTKSVLIKLSPDLIVSALTVPTSAAAGASISVTDTTKNQGQGSAAATTTTFYLSSNATWEAGDSLLKSRSIGVLASAASSSATTTGLTIPAGTAAGAWYILARADAGGGVAETNENNNVLAKAITITN